MKIQSKEIFSSKDFNRRFSILGQEKILTKGEILIGSNFQAKGKKNKSPCKNLGKKIYWEKSVLPCLTASGYYLVVTFNKIPSSPLPRCFAVLSMWNLLEDHGKNYCGGKFIGKDWALDQKFLVFQIHANSSEIFTLEENH